MKIKKIKISLLYKNLTKKDLIEYNIEILN